MDVYGYKLMKTKVIYTALGASYLFYIQFLWLRVKFLYTAM